jgi:release factor glutamine methyltransferase
VAALNAKANGVENIELRRGDIRTEVFGADRFDLIISNPPYIAHEEVRALQPEVREYEPLVATTDGADGLSFFTCILAVAGVSLRKGGWLFLEIGFAQGPAVLRLASAQGFSGGELLPDYAGIPRVFRVRRSRQ